MGDGIMELIFYRCKKLFCNGAVHITVGAALRINVRDLLIEAAFTGADVTDALQLFLKIVFAEEVFRLTQPCVIHHITLDDELL